MRSLTLSYILCALGLVCPIAGIHRLYLGKRVSGLLYMLTWGFLGAGTILDLIRMPTLVDATNFRRLPYANPERAILRLAQNNGGMVTPQVVTMNTHMTLSESQQELEKLRKNGFCNLDVSEDGAELYAFHGLNTSQQ